MDGAIADVQDAIANCQSPRVDLFHSKRPVRQWGQRATLRQVVAQHDLRHDAWRITAGDVEHVAGHQQGVWMVEASVTRKVFDSQWWQQRQWMLRRPS